MADILIVQNNELEFVNWITLDNKSIFLLERSGENSFDLTEWTFSVFFNDKCKIPYIVHSW